jgi:hypothetical protein
MCQHELSLGQVLTYRTNIAACLECCFDLDVTIVLFGEFYHNYRVGARRDRGAGRHTHGRPGGYLYIADIPGRLLAD